MSYHFTQFFSLDSPKAIKARSYRLHERHQLHGARRHRWRRRYVPVVFGRVSRALPWRTLRPSRQCVKKAKTTQPHCLARLKTVMFMRARAQFMRELHAGIGRAARKAKREGLQLCVRLNGATDLNWVAVIKAYPDIQFVDYTKSVARAIAHAAGKLPANYHVTFSYTGDNHRAASAC